MASFVNGLFKKKKNKNDQIDEIYNKDNIKNNNIELAQLKTESEVWMHNYKKKGVKIAAVTHELTLTGAPLVLLDAVKALRSLGYNVFVISPKDGTLRQQYFENRFTNRILV